MADPTFTSVLPVSGVAAGGTQITITGTNFAAGMTVTLGGIACTSLVIVSATSATCMTPAGTVGAQSIILTNVDAGTVTAAAAYTYLANATSNETKLEIWNLALLHIGERPASSLVEQSKGALLCARLYDRTVRTVLAGFPWKFATKTAALTLTAPAPTGYKYALAYDLPADCLRAREIVNQAGGLDPIEFDVEGRVLWTNDEDSVLRYTAAVADATLFDPLFISTVSLYLAVHLAIPLTGKPEVQANAFRMLQLTAPHAEATTANEQKKPGPVSGSIAGSRA